MYVTTTELWVMVGSAIVAAGASYLAGKWRAEIVLRDAINKRREIRALPGWQPVMMELHLRGYTYREVAGELNLPKEYVVKELSRAYAALRMRELCSPPRMHAIRTRLLSRLVKTFT